MDREGLTPLSNSGGCADFRRVLEKRGFGGQVRFVCGFIRQKIVVEFRTFKLAFKWPCRACVYGFGVNLDCMLA